MISHDQSNLRDFLQIRVRKYTEVRSGLVIYSLGCDKKYPVCLGQSCRRKFPATPLNVGPTHEQDIARRNDMPLLPTAVRLRHDRMSREGRQRRLCCRFGHCQWPYTDTRHRRWPAGSTSSMGFPISVL